MHHQTEDGQARDFPGRKRKLFLRASAGANARQDRVPRTQHFCEGDHIPAHEGRLQAANPNRWRFAINIGTAAIGRTKIRSMIVAGTRVGEIALTEQESLEYRL